MVKIDNSDEHHKFQWILDHAAMGFYIVMGSPQMQQKLAELYKTEKTSIYDYSCEPKPYSYREISEWVNLNQDADALFVLNMQLAFADEKGVISEDNMLHFNMSRDLLVDKQKVWIFFMTSETEYRLSTFAYDIHSYVNLKAHFQDVEDEEVTDVEDFQPQALEFDNGGSLAYVKDMLERYKEMEERYLALPLEGTSDKLLLSSAITLTNIAKLYKDALDYESSLNLLERVRIIRERILGEEHQDITNTYSEIALVYVRCGDYEEALAWYEKSLAISERLLGKGHLIVATIHNNIALVYGRQKDYQSALDWYEKSLAISEQILGKEDPKLVSTYNNIALIHGRQGDYKGALEWFRRALEICEQDSDKNRISIANLYNNTALIYHGQEDYFKALAWFQKSLEISEEALGDDHPSTATIYNNIALVYEKQGDQQGALEWFQKALGICEEALGKNHPTTVTIYNNIANIHDQGGEM